MDRSVGGPRTGPQWGSVDRGSVFSGHPTQTLERDTKDKF